MSLQRGIDGADPVRSEPNEHRHEERRAHAGRLATGTLACPRCDAPVALPAARVSLAIRLGCPYCSHTGAVRDFLSLAAPTRAARVEVRVVDRPRTVG